MSNDRVQLNEALRHQTQVISKPRLRQVQRVGDRLGYARGQHRHGVLLGDAVAFGLQDAQLADVGLGVQRAVLGTDDTGRRRLRRVTIPDHGEAEAGCGAESTIRSFLTRRCWPYRSQEAEIYANADRIM